MFAPHLPPAVAEPVGARLNSSESFSLTGLGHTIRQGSHMATPGSPYPDPQFGQQNSAAFSTVVQTTLVPAPAGAAKSFPKPAWAGDTAPCLVASAGCQGSMAAFAPALAGPSPDRKRHRAGYAAQMATMEPPPQLHTAWQAGATQTCSEQEIPRCQEVPGARRKAKMGRAGGKDGSSTR